MWHRKPLCIDSVLKNCAANRKRLFLALPNVGPYIYDVCISGFTRSSIYIYIYMTFVAWGLRHPEKLPEQQEDTTVKVMIQCSPAEFITRFSTLSRLQRVAAYCLRFSHNAKNPSLRRTGYLTSTELRDALHACIKIAQQQIYAQEVGDLSKKGQVSAKSQLQPLHPFLD